MDPYSAYMRLRVDLDPDEIMTSSINKLIRDHKGGDLYTLTCDNTAVITTPNEEPFIPSKVPWIGPAGVV